MGLDPQKSGNRWPCKCVLWMDILGTKPAICEDQGLVEEHVRDFRKRAEACFVRPPDKGLYMGFIGDGVVVAHPDLHRVLRRGGRLMRACLDNAIEQFQCKPKVSESETHKMMLLRGAVGQSPMGEVLSTPGKGCQYDTIPIIGKAFADAVKLEQIRKGSRVYVASGLRDRCSRLPIIRWKRITGESKCTCRNESADEYLWPAEAYGPKELAACVTDAYELWSKIVRCKKVWCEESYKRCPLHFDETVKVCIRSCRFLVRNSHRRMDSAMRYSLRSLLPRDKEDVEYVQYRWGFWFLAMEALLLSKGCDTDLEEVVRKAWAVIQTTPAEKKGFEAERNQPDYDCFNERLKKITGQGTADPT